MSAPIKTASTSRRSPESSRRRARNSSNSASASVGSGPASGKAKRRCPPERNAAPCTLRPRNAKNATLTAGYHMVPTEEKPAMEPDSVTLPTETAAVVPAPEPELTGPLDASALIAKALEHNVGIDTMERLLALRERLQAEQARAAFLRAL